MTSAQLMQQIDELSSHVWMVRTFIKHSEEAEDDDELAQVHRELYNFMIALGPGLDANDPDLYLKACRKKYAKLKKATDLYLEIQPEISDHTNFQMAARSLRLAVAEIGELLQQQVGN
jgi:cob(I)alamin adenosyltransferase